MLRRFHQESGENEIENFPRFSLFSIFVKAQVSSIYHSEIEVSRRRKINFFHQHPIKYWHFRETSSVDWSDSIWVQPHLSSQSGSISSSLTEIELQDHEISKFPRIHKLINFLFSSHRFPFQSWAMINVNPCFWRLVGMNLFLRYFYVPDMRKGKQIKMWNFQLFVMKLYYFILLSDCRIHVKVTAVVHFKWVEFSNIFVYVNTCCILHIWMLFQVKLVVCYGTSYNISYWQKSIYEWNLKSDLKNVLISNSHRKILPWENQIYLIHFPFSCLTDYKKSFRKKQK